MLSGTSTPLLDAEVLAAHVLGKNRSWLYAHSEDRVETECAEAFRQLVRRRAVGEPIARITGTREFWSLPIEVTGDVLIPRPETELLVELALRHLSPDRPCRIADLGTGSGAIALALATELPKAFVVGVDASASALKVSGRNARSLGLGPDRVEFRAGDWFEPLGNERFDCLVSNPPYVRENDPHLQQGDVRFEPRDALAAGPEGLDAIRRIVSNAPDHLSTGGILILEHGHDQQPTVVSKVKEAHPVASVEVHSDYGGIPRAVVAKFEGVRRADEV